jgi:phosphohistidine phosphatase
VKVYLIRHSYAVDEDVGIIDAHRHLSARGRQVARAVGAALAAEQVALDAILTSPLVRATQTAELIADAVDYLGVIEAFAGLAPGSHPRRAAEALVARGGAVAAIGHEPTISALGAFLIGREGFAPLRPCQVALVEDARPVWTLHPDVLRIEPLHAP